MFNLESEHYRVTHAFKLQLACATDQRLAYLTATLRTYFKSASRTRRQKEDKRWHFKLGLFTYADSNTKHVPKELLHSVSLQYYQQMVHNEVTRRMALTVERLFEVPATETCAVCLEDDETWRMFTLPCNERHVFHLRCLNKLCKYKKSCPTCRATFK